MNCQDEDDELQKGLEIVKGFIDECKDYVREDVDFSELCIGLKCGGSDGFSGITANPLVGRISDKVVALGGSTILTEVPEMFGAEQILMNKCINQEVFEKYKKMIVDFKKFYTDNGFPVYENPSPGNKKGGITTLEEKSLGCIQKAGTTAIVDVLAYGELVKEKGVSALDAPGNDLIASTALAASGCQLVLFTTGRGTPFSTFVPTMKIGTNNHISAKKDNWIDFNAYSMDEDGLFNLILDTVNGKVVLKSEDVREIAFYKKGVTL
jgi:altronate hydrolase